MAEEAVVRIILEGSGGAVRITGGGGGGTESTPGGGGAGGGGGHRRSATQAGGGDEFDPFAEANKRYLAERRRAQVQSAYEDLFGAEAEGKLPFNAASEAAKIRDQKLRRAEVQAELDKIMPPEPEAAFDPVAEAKKRREAELRRARVNAAYENLYEGIGEALPAEAEVKRQGETLLDAILRFRGSLTGAFGSLAGVILDVIAAVRDFEKASLKEAEKFSSGVKTKATVASKPVEPLGAIGKAVFPASAPLAGSGVPGYELKEIPLKAPKEPYTKPIFENLTGQEGAPSFAEIKGTLFPIENKRAAPPAGKPPATAAAGTPAPEVPPEAAGGAEGAGGFMASAGAVGAIVAAAVAVAKVIQGAVMGVTRANIGAALMAADANPDPAVPIMKAGEGIAAFGEKLFYVNPALGLMAQITGEATAGLGKFMQALDGITQRYGPLSAQISVAQAQADIRLALGDLRRAQEIAPEMARFIMAKSDLQDKFENIKIELLKRLVPAVTAILEQLTLLVPDAKSTTNAVEVLFPLLGALDLLGQINAAINEGNRPDPGDWDPTTAVLKGYTFGRNEGVRVPNR
jgi:hypothetical protein